MRRGDLVLLAGLAALAAFVGGAIVARPGRAPAARPPLDPPPAVASGEPRITGPREPGSVLADAAAEHARRRAVRDRLDAARTETYLGELVQAHDSSIARWPDREGDPVRIWIQPFSRLPDWTPTLVSLVRDAFLDWSDTGIPLRFTFVLDSASADARLTWIDRFDDAVSGRTYWQHDDRWSILRASIELALHHQSGAPLDARSLRAIALHEIGHLVGLDHTADSTSIMAAKVRVSALSPADRATVRLLYQLPTGPVRAGR